MAPTLECIIVVCMNMSWSYQVVLVCNYYDSKTLLPPYICKFITHSIQNLTWWQKHQSFQTTMAARYHRGCIVPHQCICFSGLQLFATYIETLEFSVFLSSLNQPFRKLRSQVYIHTACNTRHGSRIWIDNPILRTFFLPFITFCQVTWSTWPIPVWTKLE